MRRLLVNFWASHSNPPRKEASDAIWPKSAPNAASGAAVCGGSAHAQNDSATSEKATPLREAPSRRTRRETRPETCASDTVAVALQEGAPFVSASARMAASVVVGVIASGSTLTCTIEGRPEANARSYAGRN